MAPSHASHAVESDPEQQTTRVGPLMFDQLQRERQATTTPPAASSSQTTSSSSPSVVDDVGEPADEMPQSAGPTSSRASSVPDPASERMLAELIELGVTTAGTLAHDALARDQLDQELGRWLVAPAEAETIAGSLAAIAQRRGGVGPAGSPDVADLLTAAIAAAAYSARQLKLWLAARRHRTPAPATGPQEGQEAPETGDQG